MSEQTAPTTGTEETNSQGQEPVKFEAITSQEDFDKAIQARIARERAKFADYNELKTAAVELEKIRESQKTEAQKAQERLDAAEKRAAELELRSIRAEVAATKGVPASLLSGSTQADLEASADALIAFRGDQPNPSAGPFVEGINKVTPEADLAGAIAQAQKDRNFPLVATLKAQQAALQAKKG
jgi:hypothetical protein